MNYWPNKDACFFLAKSCPGTRSAAEYAFDCWLNPDMLSLMTATVFVHPNVPDIVPAVATVDRSIARGRRTRPRS
jgi:hypothetical protein